ncbi:DUF1127 domain-containing protein [Anianabacter salinae]|uniref:DUF1127 domain-containing protein n=1 Tax=Anianabacter salinae TaxID=2851023 RepID=UPI00389916C1|nr:DUF1127 domain-containing protein [Anianabacter salinae]
MASVTEIFAPSHPVGARFNGMKSELRARWESYKVYRRTVSELAALSDRELNDLGLHRSSIRGIAYEAAYGK